MTSSRPMVRPWLLPTMISSGIKYSDLLDRLSTTSRFTSLLKPPLGLSRASDTFCCGTGSAATVCRGPCASLDAGSCDACGALGAGRKFDDCAWRVFVPCVGFRQLLRPQFNNFDDSRSQYLVQRDKAIVQTRFATGDGEDRQVVMLNWSPDQISSHGKRSRSGLGGDWRSRGPRRLPRRRGNAPQSHYNSYPTQACTASHGLSPRTVRQSCRLSADVPLGAPANSEKKQQDGNGPPA